MKKFISAIMTLVMLLSCAAMAIPASAAVEVDQIADYIDYKEAYYFTSAPRIDGIITTDEWGEPTVEVDSANAVTKEGTSPNILYFHSRGDGGAETALSYKLWLRWDENYFYIGAQVEDPDGHSLKRGRHETWNGDSLQVRIDPDGPNAASYGETWEEGYTDSNKPWSSTACDLVFGYTELGGGFCEAYDNTDINHPKGMTAASNNPLGVAKLAIIPRDTNYSADSSSGITTYEIAVPWNYIDAANGATKTFTKYSSSLKDPNLAGGIGRQFGMSTALYNSNEEIKFNASNNNDLWNCFLTWGSGVDGYQGSADYGNPATCAGSNSVVLSDETITPTVTNGTEGGLPERTGLNFNVPGVDGLEVWEDLKFDDEADLDVWGGFTGGERVQLDDGNWVVKWDMWTNPLTGEYELNSVNYLITEAGDGVASFGGTFAEQWTYDTSYTFEFDVMVTGTQTFQDGHPTAIYNWFGGSSLVEYMCGYFFDEGKFKVVDSADTTKVLAEKTVNFSTNEWHHWRFQYDNPSCTLRLYFDDQLIFNFYNRYFDLSSLHEQVAMIFRRMNTQIMMDNVKITNFVDYSPSEVPETVDPNPGGGDRPSSTEIEDESGAEIGHEGSKYWATVPYRAEYATAKSLYFNVKFDASKFTFENITGLDEGAYRVEKIAEGHYRVTISKLSVLKGMKVGDTLMTVNYKSIDGVEITDEDAAALARGITAVRVSPNTGDTMMIVMVVAAAVMVMGTAIVVTRRKANDAE